MSPGRSWPSILTEASSENVPGVVPAGHVTRIDGVEMTGASEPAQHQTAHLLLHHPQKVRSLYATAFEVEPNWLVEVGARRQKWIDQAQSLNIYMAGATSKKLDECYKLAWLRGLKTTYVLRTLAATSAEKSRARAASDGSGDVAKFCSVDNPECGACQ